MAGAFIFLESQKPSFSTMSWALNVQLLAHTWMRKDTGIWDQKGQLLRSK
jgi:hypothetical protein